MPTPLAAARPPVAPGEAPARLRQAAQAFEAQALSALLAPAFATIDPSRSTFGGGAAEAQWRPMLLDAITTAATRGGARTLGIGDAVLREMLRWQAGGDPQSSPHSRTETTL